jgi:hypothetical protein
MAIEPSGQVGVAEPDDRVLACESSPEKFQVVVAEGVEAGKVAPLFGTAPAQGVEGGDAFTFEGRSGQGF